VQGASISFQDSPLPAKHEISALLMNISILHGQPIQRFAHTLLNRMAMPLILFHGLRRQALQDLRHCGIRIFESGKIPS
jgi:hypothetical protein